MIKIDGTTYHVPLTAVKREIDFLYNHADRTEDGVLHKEEIGVFINYDVVCYNAEENDEYHALVDKILEIPNTHQVTLYHGDKEYTQEAYFSGVSDELERVKTTADGMQVRYNNLKFKVIAIRPARGVTA